MMPQRMFGPVLAGCLFSITTAWPADWPQWRGPDRTDISAETGLLQSWPAGGPKRAWLYAEAGRGYSGPAIVEGRLITMGTETVDDREQEVVLTLDAVTGEKLWSTIITRRFDNRWGHGPRGTPTVAGGHIYALSGNGTLVCLEFETGDEVWRVSFTSDLGGEVPGWGYTESVLVDGDKVICTPGGGQGALAALDAKTGKVLWRSSDFTEGAQYSSPIITTHNGLRQVVQLTMRHLVGVSVDDGRLLWRTDWPGRTAVIPTPIARDGYVYVTSGYGVGCMLVKLGDGPEPDEVYANREMKNHHGGVILLGDHVYGHSDPSEWLCQDFLTGEVVWRSNQLGKGAIGYADGHFYCLEEGTGTVVLIEASPAGWNEKGRFTLEPQSRIRERSGRVWTHPVISNGRLYLRDQEYIYCYDVRD
jgi:outer membrane protein assembly factor BamB